MFLEQGFVDKHHLPNPNDFRARLKISQAKQMSTQMLNLVPLQHLVQTMVLRITRTQFFGLKIN
jgi:hypothetical protein